jgi:hypothetical protein
MSGYSQCTFAALRHIVVKTPPPFKRHSGLLRRARKRDRAACYLSEAVAVMHPAVRHGGLHLRQRECPALICPVSGTLRHAPPRPARGRTSGFAAASGEHPRTTGMRGSSAYAWQSSASMPRCASRRRLSVITCPNGSAANLPAPDGESFRQRSARLHANRAIAKPMPRSPKDLRLQPPSSTVTHDTRMRQPACDATSNCRFRVHRHVRRAMQTGTSPADYSTFKQMAANSGKRD